MQKHSNILYTICAKCNLVLLGIIMLISSCSAPKKIIYFQNGRQDSTIKTFINKEFETKITRNDIISISIFSISPETSLYNSVAGAAGTGFQADPDGNIMYPKLGVVHIIGLTRRELSARLTRDLSPYLKDPIVTIRFTNHRLTILGDVGHPQVLALPEEKITILDAIALSGDLSPNGRRDNILVIRDGENGKQFHRLDINNTSILASPYYYLKPDDVLYVEPRKQRNSANVQSIIAYAFSALSIVFFIIDRLKL